MKSLKVFSFMVGALVLSGCAKIDDGEVGVTKSFGRISDKSLSPGIYVVFPVVRTIEIWNIKTQELKETAAVPSSEGLISELDVSVIYSIDKDKAPLVRKKIGPYYQTTILEPYIREAIRNIVSGYEVKALFSEKARGEIAAKILDHLRSKLDPRGITIQDVLLRDVRLPPSFAQSIQLKLKAEQEALQKEFELQKAKKDAEIEVARAKGIAQSNEIIAKSLDPNYLRYLWIQGLQKSNKEVVYVPTEANIPIMEAVRLGKQQAPPIKEE